MDLSKTKLADLGTMRGINNGAPADGSAWQGGGDVRVFRGGSWSDSKQFVRVTERGGLYWPGHQADNIGFRLARMLP